MLETSRVAFIYIDRSPDKSDRGTGYAIGSDLLITAQHVVKNRRDLIEFQFLGETRWRLATVLWEDETLDVAVLESKESFLAHTVPLFVAPDRFRDRVESIAYGFPSFGVEVDKQDGQKICNEDSLDGWIKPKDLSATKNPKRFLMEIDGSVPDDMESWKGISGSVVFAKAAGAIVGMIGIVIEYPENRQGRQFNLISLAWIYENRSDFQEIICNRVGKIDYERSIEMLRREIYDIEQRLNVLERRKIEDGECKRLLERKREKLQGNEQVTGYNPYREKLRRVLDDIEHYDSALPNLIWTPYAHLHSYDNQDTVKRWNTIDIHDELCTSLDPELIPNFLQRAINLLQRRDSSEVGQAPELIRRLHDLLTVFPPLEPASTLDEARLEGDDLNVAPTALLLFGLSAEATQLGTTDYTLSIHHVPDSAAYQQRVRDEDSLEEAAKPLKLSADALSGLDVRLTDRDRLVFSADSDDVEAVREILTAIVQAVFDTYPELEDSPPHLYFFLPKSLLTLDCHNLEFDCDDGYLRLGRQHPVVVTCLERHKQPKSSRARRIWTKRWNDRDGNPKPLHQHIYSCSGNLNGQALNFRDKRTLSMQLQQIDSRGAKIIGLQFTENDLGFQTTCDALFLVGLSLFLVSGSPLTPTETNNLSQALRETCVDRFLMAVKDRYRICPEFIDNAGSLSVLMDNPYLPLPEIDYF